MQIGPVIVHLPDLDQSVADRVSAGVQNLTAQVGYLAHGWRDGVVDDEQIVVGVERQMVGIKRPFRLPRRTHELFGKGAGLGVAGKNKRDAGGEQAEPGCSAAQQFAS